MSDSFSNKRSPVRFFLESYAFCRTRCLSEHLQTIASVKSHKTLAQRKNKVSKITLLYFFNLSSHHRVTYLSINSAKYTSFIRFGCFNFYLIYGSRYSRMDQVKFMEDNFKKFEVIWSAQTFYIFYIQKLLYSLQNCVKCI